MILHCQKTGREFPAATMGIARRVAFLKGLTDWVFIPKGVHGPATIGETVNAMRTAGKE